jgi:hypothetical protein
MLYLSTETYLNTAAVKIPITPQLLNNIERVVLGFNAYNFHDAMPLFKMLRARKAFELKPVLPYFWVEEYRNRNSQFAYVALQ